MSCLQRVFRGILIRRVCSHVAENEAVMTPRKITLLKYKSRTEQ